MCPQMVLTTDTLMFARDGYEEVIDSLQLHDIDTVGTQTSKSVMFRRFVLVCVLVCVRLYRHCARSGARLQKGTKFSYLKRGVFFLR